MSSYLTAKQFEEFETAKKLNKFPSEFNFLQNHNGPRGGMIHGILGTSGSGKSTLARSLIIEFARSARIFVWLSEETTQSYSWMLNRITREKKVLDNIFMFSELELDPHYTQDIQTFHNQFEERCSICKPELIFIDNITTSYMYDEHIKPEGQRASANRLVKFATKTNLPIFYIAHTKKGITDNDGLLDICDIRGSAVIVNLSGFLYTFQRIVLEESFYPLLVTRKHRNFDGADGYYLVRYEKGIYKSDEKLSGKDVKAALSQRF